MHTEEQAREKACHQSFQRHPTSNDPIHNRCIASDCMAWRWGNEYETRINTETATGKALRKGCCGLAGQP